VTIIYNNKKYMYTSKITKPTELVAEIYTCYYQSKIRPFGWKNGPSIP